VHLRRLHGPPPSLTSRLVVPVCPYIILCAGFSFSYAF
jgi:hypothetical protein